MRANLDLTQGAIMAEALMMASAPVLGRDRAHHELIRLSRAAAAQGVSLAECAGADAALSQALGAEGIERALDPAAYLGESGSIAHRAAAAARSR
jgi:3-carboxy-cis,cis-muconate cycloisomerase